MSDAEQDDSQKTEDPTRKRIEESRKKGQVALSREVNNWLMIFAGTMLLAFMSRGVLGDLETHLKTYIEFAHGLPTMPGGAEQILGQSFFEVVKILFLPLLFLMAIAFIGPFGQVGPLFSVEAITPKLSKISPISGFKRLFSRRSLMEFLKGLLKLAAVSVVGVMILRPYLGAIDHMVGLPLPLLLDEMLHIVIRMLIGVLIVLVVVAAIDLSFQRMDHMRKLRMSKQEVKDEYKQSEGDPHVKGRLRQLRIERARRRMMAAVPEADVVITNPTHFAIALKYDPDQMEAPVCIAKGQDHLALKIREIANDNEVEIVENPPLARALFDSVELDEVIPIEHYKAVAEVISFVFRKKGKL